MRKSSLEIAQGQIKEYVEEHHNAVFSLMELKEVLAKNREKWKIAISTDNDKFISFVTGKGLLEEIIFSHEKEDERKLYKKPSADLISTFPALRRSAYYTHYTAMHLHNLTLQIPKTVYLNFEHSNPYSTRPNNAELLQESIDKAFAKPQRASANYYSHKGTKVYLLNGKYTGRLGVIADNEESAKYYYTDLERTLIDITIRPAYSGGIYEVLEAYENAKERIDVDKLLKYVDALNYIYPYKQLIGFYLDRAGYGQYETEVFKKDMRFDFYTSYSIKRAEYDSEWRIYYPKGF